MYRYDEFDAQFVADRLRQFRDQIDRRLRGDLTEDQFKPMRLMNGLYLQLHAYMLRVAIPYGVLSANQMRQLAMIAERWDRGYGHFTTRQNIQFNWPALADVGDILEALAKVEMHAIQTSGNCIRNVTTDQFAGVAADEILDPRPHCELLRQWSSLHPEFSFLPRKFKIAVTGSPHDRAAVKFHDIGLRMHRDRAGLPGFEVIVGGGLGRTPMVGKIVREWLPENELVPYITAIMRVYNRFGRRDNKYKARIKILVHELGLDAFRELVEAEYAKGDPSDTMALASDEIARIERYFAMPDLPQRAETVPAINARIFEDREFGAWMRLALTRHKVAGYRAVTISLKPVGGIPGDASAQQMRAVAELADRFSLGEIRVTHEQNLVLPHVAVDDLFDLWQGLKAHDLATANQGLLSDIIACPGMDYCALATARSIPIAQAISRRFAALDRQDDVGALKIKISGCINACGHHHAGHIGILGVDRKGEELYQITLGGSGDEAAAIGKIIGPGFLGDDVVNAVETIIETYLAGRNSSDEQFLDYYRRAGPAPFKSALYKSGVTA